MICYKCNQEGNFSGRNKICNTCRSRQNNERITLEQNRAYQLKSLYGITPEEWDRMYEEQDGVCAICLQAETQNRRMAVDHCHVTGKVRGLLCQACNTGIGKLGDCPDRLRRAAQYLID